MQASIIITLYSELYTQRNQIQKTKHTTLFTLRFGDLLSVKGSFEGPFKGSFWGSFQLYAGFLGMPGCWAPAGPEGEEPRSAFGF